MNQLQKAYCDGAAMAYRDVSKQIKGMVKRCPPEVRSYMEVMLPLADVCNSKAVIIYKECEQYTAGVRQ